MGPSFDTMCMDCGKYAFDIDDALDATLKEGGIDRYPQRGKHYFDVTCPSCSRKQGLVIRPSHGHIFTIWPCSWNDETCCEDGCEYCEGEYV